MNSSEKLNLAVEDLIKIAHDDGLRAVVGVIKDLSDCVCEMKEMIFFLNRFLLVAHEFMCKEAVLTRDDLSSERLVAFAKIIIEEWKKKVRE